MRKFICLLLGHNYQWMAVIFKGNDKRFVYIPCIRCGNEKIVKDLHYWNMVDYWKVENKFWISLIKEVIKMAKVKKGSAAAKAKMAKIRATAGKGKKKNAKGSKAMAM